MFEQILYFMEFLLETFLIVTIVDIFLIGLPILKVPTKLEKESFLITKPNHSEKQGKVECSGFSSAYVYRHLGKEVAGQDLYKENIYVVDSVEAFRNATTEHYNRVIPLTEHYKNS